MKKSIELNIEIYPLSTTMKAAYNYTNKSYIFFDKVSEEIYKIEFESKEENIDINTLILEFKNDLLHEAIRKNISTETKNIRELILARALYGFALENNEEKKIENSTDLESSELSYKDDNENIGKSWF